MKTKKSFMILNENEKKTKQKWNAFCLPWICSFFMQTTIIERPEWIKKNNTHTYKRKQKVLKLEVKNLRFFFLVKKKNINL